MVKDETGEDLTQTKERVFKRFGDEIKYPRLRAKIGFEETIQDLIHICATCDPQLFPENVHRLFYSMPSTMRDPQYENDLEECKETAEYTTPIPWCGVFITNPEMPGKIEVVEEWNWHLVYNAILNLWNRRDALLPRQLSEVITSE